jgi:phosphoribosylanthranilate isomerase
VSPLVKICGLRRVQDAELAVALGATHVGAVRTKASPRRASLDEAREIFDAVASRAIRVLVFRDVPIEDVVRDARASGADCVQLYEGTDRDFERLESEGLRVLRVYRVEEDSHALPAILDSSHARPALLDVAGGGTGRRFDWRLLGSEAPPFTFVAGGIRAENVGELLHHHPYGVDLSSGVERAPGVKDPEKLRGLFERIGRHHR